MKIIRNKGNQGLYILWIVLSLISISVLLLSSGSNAEDKRDRNIRTARSIISDPRRMSTSRDSLADTLQVIDTLKAVEKNDTVNTKLHSSDSLKASQKDSIKVKPLNQDTLSSKKPLEPKPEARISLPFKVGEKLDFKVYFEFVLGGDAIMQVHSIDSIDGKKCIKIITEAKSSSTVDMFYKVRDHIESWIDINGYFSRRYHKKLSEGKHKYDERVEYMPEKSIAHLFRKKRTEPEILEVEGEIQDVLSAFYVMRGMELEVGKSLFIDVHDIDKQYKLEVKIAGKEKVEVPAGTFDCFVVEPLLQSSGIFRKEGDLQIWITDDEVRMPVLMKSKLYFGRVWAKLVKYNTGSGSLKN